MSPGIPSTPESLPFVNYFILLFITSKYESNARESIASLRETLLIEFIFAFVSRLNASLNCSAQRFNISLESVRRIPSVERTMEDPSLLGPLQILIKNIPIMFVCWFLQSFRLLFSPLLLHFLEFSLSYELRFSQICKACPF